MTPSGGTPLHYVMPDITETCLSCPLSAKTRVRTGIEPTLAGPFAVPMMVMVKKNILKIPPGTAEMIHMVRLPTGTLKFSRLWGRELR